MAVKKIAGKVEKMPASTSDHRAMNTAAVLVIFIEL